MASIKESEHLSLPFQIIEAATKNFSTLIGKGGYGLVYKGELSLSGELTTVAVKRLLFNDLSGQGLKEFLTEIQLLSRYKHPNLVSLLGYCEERKEKVLIFEYAHRGSLEKYLRNAQNSTCTLTWKQRLNICIDAARGLDHLHNHVAEHERVIHRDIKSANILIDHNWKAMIADLGLSKLGRANENDTFLVTNACGTAGYCDPVYKETGVLTKESDVYSFGIVLFEVLCGRLCFLPNVERKQRFLPQLAQRCYKKERLNLIIDPTLKKYMDTDSMKKFSRIAYQCLLEDRKGRPSMDLVLQELEKALYMLESKSENTLSGGNWIPISLPESWDQDVPPSNMSELRVNSTEVLDEIFWEQVGITVNILRIKKSDHNVKPADLLDDLLVKCFTVLKKSLDNNSSGFGDSYNRHWVAIVDLYKEVSGIIVDAPERLIYESVACVTIIISRVVQVLKASLSTEHADVATNGLQEILDHDKASAVTDALLSCLVTCGTSLMSGSSKLLRAACEACEAIWSLICTFEIHCTKENAPVFPLSSMYSHSLDKININGDECGPFIGNYYEKIVEAVTQAFLRSEALRVAFFYCLRQRLEASWSSVIKIILRCCLHNESVTSVLCGLSSSSVVGGCGDNTIVSEVFSILSLCASFDRDPQPGDTNNLKSKVSNPCDLILHSCLFVASVAQSLDSFERNTAVIMLTSSRTTQQSRLSDLAHHYSFCDGIHDIQPHSMSAMLALAYICSLENNESAATSIREIALPLIPPSATLHDYLRRMLTTHTQGDKIMLSYWHGFRDGCVVLLYFRIDWGRPLAIHDLGGGHIPQSLIDLLGNKHSDEIGLSPLGVRWAVSLLMGCLHGGSSVFRQVLLTREHVKVVCDLISDVHIKLIRCWGGLGRGKNGVRDTVNSVVCLLGFPYAASEDSNVLRNMEPHDREDMVIEIKTRMEEYIEILLEVGFPGQLIKCLDHLELKDTDTPVGILSQMAVHRSLVVELISKGLLNPNLMKRLLDDSSPIRVKVFVLKIVSEVAAMDQEFYEHINGADILQQLKAFLTHEDPNMRALTCRAIREMCLHSSYFYEHINGADILQQLKACLAHEDPDVRAWACRALGHMCLHSSYFYEHINGADIVQQLKACLTHEDPDVRASACRALGEMCRHSSYFYSLLEKHNIISMLVDLLFDKDNYTQRVAVFAIGNTAYHSDLFYEDLRICIPQLAELLLSAETTNLTKENAATCLGILCVYSDKLSEDMISKGAMEGLLKVVEDYSVVALDPSRINAINELLLSSALLALAKMCKHPPCRKFIGISDTYPVIGQLRESLVEDIANYATLIFNMAAHYGRQRCVAYGGWTKAVEFANTEDEAR